MKNSIVSLAGQRVTVVGLGTQGGGIGTVCWLLEQGARVVVSDHAQKEVLAESLKRIALFRKQYERATGRRARIVYHLGKEHTEQDIAQADLIVMNPDVPNTSPVFAWARQYKIPIRIGDTSLFIERCTAPIIGVTGTRGKTTTTSLIGAILRRVDRRSVVAGNLRVSPLEDLGRIERSQGRKPFVALELSSWQVEGLRDIKESPSIAILTNIFPDHLNRYQSIAEYANAKARIFEYQRPSDDAILNYDNVISRRLGKRIHATLWWVTDRPLPMGVNGAYMDNGWITIRKGKRAIRVMERKESPLLGVHQNTNILAAVLACWLAHVNASQIRHAVRSFNGVAGRLEHVRTHNGIQYINDTAATSPDAVIAALHAVQKRPNTIVLIAGGTDKNLEYDALVKKIRRLCRAVVLLPGSATEKMKAPLLSTRTLIVKEARTMSEALATAQSLATPGDTILLSPAAASFGLFKNAYDRGDQFRALVQQLS